MRRILVLAGLLAIASCRVAPNPPPAEGDLNAPSYVRAADSAAVIQFTPADSPAVWLLAHLDVETTGLVPGYHEPVDLGLVMTDLGGNVIDSLFLRIVPERIDRVSEGATRVNGFSAERWRQLGALTHTAAVDSIFAFHRRVAGGRPVLLVAFNSQFDTAFLDFLMRSAGHSWRELYHYFVLDIPSMAWAKGYRDLGNAALAKRLGVTDEPRAAQEHTGLTGAMLNVRIYQALQRADEVKPEAPPALCEVTAAPPAGIGH